MQLTRPTFAQLWHDLLETLMSEEAGVSPRGMKTKEIINVHLELTDPWENILGTPERKLAYKFMVAEWLWIWYGHNDVRTIVPYNPHIAQFSDDGEEFFGAYGPRVNQSWGYVFRLLKDDPDTRQAVICIYRPPPGKTKDVPCTLTMQFLLRDGCLNAIVNMRSSDTWLGLPYDYYTFSMLQITMATMLCARVGSLYFNLGSSHLYERNFEAAHEIAFADPVSIDTPVMDGYPPMALETVLTKREPRKLHHPWSMYRDVLLASSNKDARGILLYG
jgi:thymidylate synthase